MFGVPSLGMQVSHIITVVEGQPNKELIQNLQPTSLFLSELNRQYDGITMFRKIRTICLYETKTSPTVEVIGY